ncbi:hypothetical protein, partial [Tenacibaculum sp. L6]|uniref:hypothetical protein n=1 Tax=Tenacibaculum sp. L6 TaxID=2992764 RepID=UPI00237A829F
ETPVAVEKTIMVDIDKDPFYDSKTKVNYFKYKGKQYGFLIDQKDLLITRKVNNEDVTSARAYRSINNDFYVVQGDEFNGVGYFNKYGDFIIEYRNKETNKLEYAIFETVKM